MRTMRMAPALVILGAVACATPAKPAPEPVMPAAASEPSEGERLMASGALDSAIAHYRERTTREPDAVDGWHGLGAACYRAGDSVCAGVALERAYALAPDDPGVLASLGLLRLGQGRHEDAASLLRRAVSVDPSHGPAHNNLGLTLRAMGDHPGARSAFEAALRQTPDDPVALENLGLVLLYDLGDARAARVHLDRRLALLRAAGGDVKADDLRDAGLAALFSDDGDAALGHLEQAHAMEPARADLMFHLGMAFVQVSELDRARALLKSASEADPQQALYVGMLGRLLARMKRCPEALGPLDRALELDPEDPQLSMASGICRQATGDEDGARIAFARACAQGLADACEDGRAK